MCVRLASKGAQEGSPDLVRHCHPEEPGRKGELCPSGRPARAILCETVDNLSRKGDFVRDCRPEDRGRAILHENGHPEDRGERRMGGRFCARQSPRGLREADSV